MRRRIAECHDDLLPCHPPFDTALHDRLLYVERKGRQAYTWVNGDEQLVEILVKRLLIPPVVLLKLQFAARELDFHPASPDVNDSHGRAKRKKRSRVIVGVGDDLVLVVHIAARIECTGPVLVEFPMRQRTTACEPNQRDAVQQDTRELHGPPSVR
jgi:hypothetical protein